MSWRVAESLEKLRKQLNSAFPNRSKLSDGGIGDAKHASRSSDHNPWVKDKNGTGVVTARDFTHDPKNGLDCNKLAEWLIESRDPRIKYIIWNHRILSSKNSPWKWRPYSGANAHTKHLHLSVNAEAKHYDNPADWDLDIAISVPAPKPIILSDGEIDNLLSQNLQNSTARTEVAASPTPPQNPQIPVEPAVEPAQAVTAAETNVSVEDGKVKVQTNETNNFTPEKFDAFIPQIETGKSWMKWLIGMTGLGSITAWFANLPLPLQITFGVAFVGVVIGAVIMLIKYHEKVFQYVGLMNEQKADPTKNNPEIKSL